MRRPPTNRVLYVLTRIDGTEIEVDRGKAVSEADLPQPGAFATVNDIGCRVIAVAKTPHTIYTWTVLFLEHDLGASIEGVRVAERKAV